MAKVVDLNMSPDIEDLMLSSVKTKNRYYSNSIIDRKIAVGGRQYDKLESRSHMKKLGIMWRGLTQAQRDAWSSAGANSDMTGWQLFLQDTSFRLRANLPGFATPSDFHQYKVFIFDNTEWDQEFNLFQNHYDVLYYHKKNVGQKNARTWTFIGNDYFPPAKLEFSFFSEMEATPDFDSYYISIELWGKKDDVFVDDYFSFDLPLVADWYRFSENLSVDFDTIDAFWLDINGVGLRGVFMLDNLNVDFGGVNLARDWKCDDAVGAELWAEDIEGNGSIPAWLGEGPADGLVEGSYYLA